MSAEEIKAVIRRLIEEVYNEDDQDILDGVMYVRDGCAHPLVDIPEPLDAVLVFGNGAVVENVWGHELIEDMIAERDMVTCSCTHEGELWGTPPTGKRF